MTWQIVGHEWAVDLLRQSLARGRGARSVLLAGPPQVGKTTLAVALAQAWNCQQPEAPCGQCPACKKIEAGTHPDVRLVVGEGARGAIKIEQIRALQHDAVLAPYEGQYRVLILCRADLATLEAANSLLKTLEEPPAHLVLVLTAVQAEALPATVLSRCQRLDLRPVAQAKIEAALQQRGAAPARARLLARLSSGRIGWALQALEDEAVLRQRQEYLDQLVELLPAGRVKRLDFAWQASRDPAAAQAQIEAWIGWWRDLLLLSSQGQDHVLNLDRLDELGSLAERIPAARSWLALGALRAAAEQLQANVNPRLALESLLLKLPKVAGKV